MNDIFILRTVTNEMLGFKATLVLFVLIVLLNWAGHSGQNGSWDYLTFILLISDFNKTYFQIIYVYAVMFYAGIASIYY